MFRKTMKGLLVMLVLNPFTGLAAGQKHEVATFAGGCFWCVESAFEGVPGVISVVSGYTGAPLKTRPMRTSHPGPRVMPRLSR